jgi:hypothetical protein
LRDDLSLQGAPLSTDWHRAAWRPLKLSRINTGE